MQVTTIDDIKNALLFAKENNLKVSPAGVRHSMGGQAFFKNALVLDMTQFNKMSLDEEQQNPDRSERRYLARYSKFPSPQICRKAMQSTDIFTVGGSISVNAHGMDHQVGAIGKTIRSMRLMLPDGSIQRLSRDRKPGAFQFGHRRLRFVWHYSGCGVRRLLTTSSTPQAGRLLTTKISPLFLKKNWLMTKNLA